MSEAPEGVDANHGAQPPQAPDERVALRDDSERSIARMWLEVADIDGRPIVYQEGSFWEWQPARGYYVRLSTEQATLDVQRRMWGWPLIVVRAGEDGPTRTRGAIKPKWSACERIIKAARGELEFDPALRRLHGVATQTGVWVAIDGNELVEVEASPAAFVTSCFPVQWNPSAAAPERWLQTLREVWEDREDCEDRIQFLHEFLGAALFGLATEYDTAVILFGQGGNGKSVVTDTVAALFDDQMISHVAPQDWENEYYAAMLAGSRLNVVEELPQRKIIATSTFKSVITGGSIVGRHIREKPFSFRPSAGHIFATNELPRTGDMSAGFWRRARVLEFTRRFDTAPGRRLRSDLVDLHVDEAEGIFRLCAEGVLRLMRRGGYTHTDQESVVREWRMDSCSVAAFIGDCTRPKQDESEETRMADLYSAYTRYCDAGRFQPVNIRSFQHRLALNGIDNVRRKLGNNRERWYFAVLA